MSSKEVIVCISSGSEDIRVGNLCFHVNGHKESTSFGYDKKWFDHRQIFYRKLFSPFIASKAK